MQSDLRQINKKRKKETEDKEDSQLFLDMMEKLRLWALQRDAHRDQYSDEETKLRMEELKLLDKIQEILKKQEEHLAGNKEYQLKIKKNMAH